VAGDRSGRAEEELTGVVCPRGRHDPDRTAVRHGHQTGEVTLGGRRVVVQGPRVRTADGGEEVPLQTYGTSPTATR
jgi:putative transposase